MAFPVQKRIDLSFLGAEWSGAELVFRALTFKETRDLAGLNFDEEDPTAQEKSVEFVTKFLGDHFISGKAFNGDGLVPVTKDDLDELPVDVVNKAVEVLSGQTDPKS